MALVRVWTDGPTGRASCSPEGWSGAYLARIDLVATECILVGTHDGGLGWA